MLGIDEGNEEAMEGGEVLGELKQGTNVGRKREGENQGMHIVVYYRSQATGCS